MSNATSDFQQPRGVGSMRACSQCGTENGVTSASCISCGVSLTSGAVEYYVLQARTNEILGPISEEGIKEWILQKRITSRDSLTLVGDSTWTPLLQSQFSQNLVEQINVERLTASTCPRCGAGMVAVARGSQLGLWLIIVGVVLTPVFCIGTFLWVWGMILRHGMKGKTYLQCPRCKYSAP
jgi:DNA-directed RNA polymerase subunit M/transcription elongation factor TFIIS